MSHENKPVSPAVPQEQKFIERFCRCGCIQSMHAGGRCGGCDCKGFVNVTVSDEQRWAMVQEAISTPELTSDLARLAAISAVVNSRKPPTDDDIQWAQKVSDPRPPV